MENFCGNSRGFLEPCITTVYDYVCDSENNNVSRHHFRARPGGDIIFAKTASRWFLPRIGQTRAVAGLAVHHRHGRYGVLAAAG